MSGKINPRLGELNIYLVIDSKKAENKFEDFEKRFNVDPQKWSHVTLHHLLSSIIIHDSLFV